MADPIKSKADQPMLQSIQDGATGYQTQVVGGPAYIGPHYHVEVSQTNQPPKTKTFDFKPYLQSIVDDEEYRGWQDLYTPTTVEGCKQVPQKKSSPRLKLRLETVKPSTEKLENRTASEGQEQVKQWEVLAGLRKFAADHVLLIGKPGSGKSTALAWLLWQEANTALQNSAAKIPVLVKLRRCTSTIEKLIQDFFSGHQLSLDVADIEELLHQGKLLLLLDGLNELPETFRTEIANFRDRYRSTTAMIVSTRELSMGGTLGITKTLKMLPMTELQMQEFVRGYLGDKGEQLFQQLKGDRLRKFAETPLLLWMLCRVFDEECVQAEKENRPPQLPENLGLAFRAFTQLYDQGTEEQQAIQADAPVDSRKQWPKLLRHLAFALMHDKEPVEFRLSMPREEAENLLTDCLQQEGRTKAREDAERWLNDLLTYHLIQPVIQPNFEEHIEFRHQLIQEYYAAEYLLGLLPELSDDQLKRDYLNYLKWTEPLALMLGLATAKGKDAENETEKENKRALALQLVKLALEVDWRLGARLAGEVRQEFQKQTVALVNALEVPRWLKVELLKQKDSDVEHLEAPALMNSDVTIPELLQAFEDVDRSDHMEIWSALRKIGTKPVILGLLDIALKHPDPGIRYESVQILNQINCDDTVVPALLHILKDSDEGVRFETAIKLGDIGSESAVPGLLHALQDSEDIVRYCAAEALGKIGSRAAVSGLINALKDSDDDVRYRAAEALGKIGSEMAIPELLRALEDSDPRGAVRDYAAKALDKIDSKLAIPVLLTALKDSDAKVRGRAAEMLGNISSAREEVIQNLLDALKDSDTDVRSYVIQALGKIGSEAAIPALLTILEDENSLIRSDVAIALGEIGSETAIPALLVTFENSDDDVVRSCVVQALGKIGSEVAIPALLTALHDSYPIVRLNATEALGKIGSKKVIPALLTALQDPYPEVQLFAAEALEKINPEAAIPALLGLLEAANFWIRKRAMAALGRIGSKEVIPSLLNAIRDFDYEIRKSAADALVTIDSESVIQAILDIPQIPGIGSESVVQALRDIPQVPGFEVPWDFRDALKNLSQTQSGIRYLVHIIKHSDIGHVREITAEIFGTIPGSRAAFVLPDLLALIPTQSGKEAFQAILAIQKRCKFYNYEIWQAAATIENLKMRS